MYIRGEYPPTSYMVSSTKDLEAVNNCFKLIDCISFPSGRYSGKGIIVHTSGTKELKRVDFDAIDYERYNRALEELGIDYRNEAAPRVIYEVDDKIYYCDQWPGGHDETAQNTIKVFDRDLNIVMRRDVPPGIMRISGDRILIVDRELNYTLYNLALGKIAEGRVDANNKSYQDYFYLNSGHTLATYGYDGSDDVLCLMAWERFIYNTTRLGYMINLTSGEIIEIVQPDCIPGTWNVTYKTPIISPVAYSPYYIGYLQLPRFDGTNFIYAYNPFPDKPKLWLDAVIDTRGRMIETRPNKIDCWK